jgi:hypothetical protein
MVGLLFRAAPASTAAGRSLGAVRSEKGKWTRTTCKDESGAAKARAGSLSGGEAAELENYHHAGRLLELLQSKARLSLKRLVASA